MAVISVAMLLTSCGRENRQDGQDNNMEASVRQSYAKIEEGEKADDSTGIENNIENGTGNSQEADNRNGEEMEAAISEDELEIAFGDQGAPFTMHLYENETAQAIADHVGTADWRLPIYHYDDYEGWEYFQYYDIPERYEIPSDPEVITSAKAGEVYYSEPNRIILFYQDAEISGEYTPIGYIDYSEEFEEAAAENPVLEGWGNKIVLISEGQ